MIQISEAAQSYFRGLIAQQDDAIGIRLTAMRPGTPTADARLEFCDVDDLLGDEWALDCDGFTLYVDGASVPYLDAAELDFSRNETGGQVTVRAPHIKGVAPNADASVIERIRHVLESEINPQLASHGGRVALEQFTAEGTAVLRFGGGCHGCGMVDVTLKQGVEKTLKARVPEVTAVADATDHQSGAAPYYKRADG